MILLLVTARQGINQSVRRDEDFYRVAQLLTLGDSQLGATERASKEAVAEICGTGASRKMLAN